MRRAFTIVVSVAIGAAALLVAIVLIGWHRQNVASDKNEAAAIKAIEAAAAALRASPLTVGQLKTLATPRSDPDRGRCREQQRHGNDQLRNERPLCRSRSYQRRCGSHVLPRHCSAFRVNLTGAC